MLAYQVICEISSIRGVLATCILDQIPRENIENTTSNPYFVKLLLPAVTYLSSRSFAKYQFANCETPVAMAV